MAQELESLFENRHQIFLTMGAALGFLSTFLTVKREITKGPKVRGKILESKLDRDSTVTRSVVQGARIEEYSGTFSVKVQLQNSGTDLTSVISCSLILPSGENHRPSVTKRMEPPANSSRLAKFLPLVFRIKDERVLIIPAGAALIEKFQFDVTSREDFKTSTTGEVIFEFVNHRKVSFVTEFERRK